MWPITKMQVINVPLENEGGGNSTGFPGTGTNSTGFPGTGTNSTIGMAMNKMKRMKRQIPTPEHISAVHIITQIDKLHTEGFSGKGVRVAVLDTGVNYLHPALGGCFGPGCLVTHGYDLVDNDDDPYSDCNDHGIHVAGIIAAQTNPLGFIGAAPGATLGAYRIANCFGTIETDWLLAGANQAYDDGSDIINLSLTFDDLGWSQDPISLALQRIVDAGVPVVAAEGNLGRSGPFWSGSPATANGVAGVASFVNPETPQIMTAGSSYMVDGGEAKPFLFRQQFTFPTVSLPLVALTNDTRAPRDGCEPLPEGTDLSGKIVLVLGPEGPNFDCHYQNKVDNLRQYGLEYIIFYAWTFP